MLLVYCITAYTFRLLFIRAKKSLELSNYKKRRLTYIKSTSSINLIKAPNKDSAKNILKRVLCKAYFDE